MLGWMQRTEDPSENQKFNVEVLEMVVRRVFSHERTWKLKGSRKCHMTPLTGLDSALCTLDRKSTVWVVLSHGALMSVAD